MIDKRKIIKLSNDMEVNALTPKHIPGLKIRQKSFLEKDGANVFEYSLSTHTGTHVDLPGHMIKGGKVITDFHLSDFIFDNPVAIQVPLLDNQLITKEMLSAYDDILRECDMLLIKTGWARVRKLDPHRYKEKSPGLSIQAAQYLSAFVKIMSIGIDAISFASPKHLDEGVHAHKILMKARSKMQLYEDLDLSRDLSNLKQVIALPLIIRGVDSASCTIMGVLE